VSNSEVVHTVGLHCTWHTICSNT